MILTYMKKAFIEIHGYLFLLLIFVNFTSLAAQECRSNQQFAIEDQSISNLSLVVENAVLNNLASPQQGVCAVFIEFSHQFLGDVSMQLVSPSGQIVQLIGPTGLYGNTNFSQWNISFVGCSTPASPDLGFTSTWANNQSWGILGRFNGSYRPSNGCLEDFNTGPVNGLWTLHIEDVFEFGSGIVQSFSIVFCDNRGLECDQCTSSAGSMEGERKIFCREDPALNLDLNPYEETLPPDPTLYDYAYLVSTNDSIIDILESPDLRNYEDGIYSVCGVSYRNTDVSIQEITDLLLGLNTSNLINFFSSPTLPICADLTTVCQEVQIISVLDTISIDRVLCPNQSYIFNGETFVNSGTYYRIFGQELCDSAAIITIDAINIQPRIESDFTIIDCETDSILLRGNNSLKRDSTIFIWSTLDGLILSPPDEQDIYIGQGGRYTLTLIENGCQVSSSIVISNDTDIPVLILDSDTITCSNPNSNIHLESNVPLATISWTGPNDFISSASDFFTTIPGLYQVAVIGENGCRTGSSIQVFEDIIEAPLSFSVDSIDCNRAIVTLAYIPDTVGYSFQWNGPAGISGNNSVLTTSTPGNYQVQIRGQNGCVADTTLNVVDYRISPSITSQTDTLTCTSPSSVIQISSSIPLISYSWTGPDFFSSQELEPEVNLSGNYFLTAIGQNGCNVSFQTTVIKDNLLPEIEAIGGEISCSMQNVTLDWVSTNAGIVVTWEGPGIVDTNNPNPEVSSEGWYVVTGRTPNGCSATDSVFVFRGPDVPFLSLRADTIICGRPDVLIESNGSVDFVYQWTGPNGFQSMDRTPLVSEGGSYQVMVVDTSLGCQEVFSVNVVVDTLAPILEVDDKVLNCIADIVQLSPLNIDSSYTYQWRDVNNNILADSFLLETAQDGNYMISAIAPNNCGTEIGVTVTRDTLHPVLMASDVTTQACAESIDLSASTQNSQDSIFWSGPNNFSDEGFIIKAIDPGNYRIIAKSTNGCQDTTEISLSIDSDFPVVNFDAVDQLTCALDSVSINVDSTIPNSTFAWSGPGNFTSNRPMNIVGLPGDYQVIVTAPNDCRIIDTLTVLSLQDFPTYSIDFDTITCAKPNIELGISSPDDNFTTLWTSPSGEVFNTQNIMVSVPGMYNIDLLTELGCTLKDSINIEIDTTKLPLSTSVSNIITCAETTTTLQADFDTLVGNIMWILDQSVISIEPELMVTSGGTYTAQVTNKNGCVTEMEVLVQQDTIKPSIITEDAFLTCSASKLNLPLQIENPLYTVTWIGPNGFASNDINPIIIDTGTYMVQVTDFKGCSSMRSIAIGLDTELPVIDIQDGNLPCDNQEYRIIAENPENAPLIYQWFGPNQFRSDELAPIVVDTGTYNLLVIGENGCLLRDSIFINNMPIYPQFSLVEDTITCKENSLLLQIIDFEDDRSVMWIGPDGFISNSPNASIDQTGLYYATVTGTNGCELIDSVFIAIDTISPIAVVNHAEPFICENRIIDILSTGSSTGDDISYNWNTSNGNILSPTNGSQITVDALGSYTLQVFDEKNGCTGTSSISVVEENSDLENIVYTTQSPTCKGFVDGIIEVNSIIGGMPPYSYSLNGSEYKEDPVFNGLAAGVSNLSVKDAYGCVLDQEIVIEPGTEVVASIDPSYIISLGDTLSLEPMVSISGGDIDKIIWTSPELDVETTDPILIFSPISNQEVKISISTLSGCVFELETTIIVDNSVNVYIPNVFRKDGSDINGSFQLFPNNSVLAINNFQIYDRWGNQVFAIQNWIPGFEPIIWDGTFGGRDVLPGVFVYLIDYELIDGKQIRKSGDITVLQ